MDNCKGGVSISFSQWPVRDPERVTGQVQSTEFTAGATWEWRGSPGLWEDFFFFLSYSEQIYTQTWLAWSKVWVHFPNSSWALDQLLSLQKGTRELFFRVVSALGSGWCRRGGCAVRSSMSGLHMGSAHTLLQGLGRRAVTTRGDLRNVWFTIECM